MSNLARQGLPGLLVLVCAASAWAQPTITSISPGYGGAGPNSPLTYNIVGSGFVTAPNGTRFVDAAGMDLFSTLTCSTTATCVATGVRPFLAPTGVVATLQLKAIAAGGTSTSSVSFVYYGAPTISSLTPSSGPYDLVTPLVLSGSAFATAGSGFPGTTSILIGTTNILGVGCATTTSCSGTARSLASDPLAAQGAQIFEVRTPGGVARTEWIYGPAAQMPPTPTITSVSDATGPAGGGNVVVIRGTNFLTGPQVPIGGGFTISRGTMFNFISPAGTAAAANVNCPAATRCIMTVPAGIAGPVSLEAYTICGAGMPPCSGNARPSVSRSSGQYVGLYAYAGIKLTPGSVGPIVVSGFTASYNVSLYGPPTANVHINMSVVPGAATTAPTALDFTPMNWAEPQTVTVSAGDAAFAVRNIASSADPNYSGLESDQQAATVFSDMKRYIVTPQYGLVTTRSGGSATFTIALTQSPTHRSVPPICDLGEVSVALATSDPAAGTVTAVNPSSLNFTTEPGPPWAPSAWYIPRTVTVTGADDGMLGVRRDYSILVQGGTELCDPTGGYSVVTAPAVHVVNIDAAATPTGLALTRTGLDRAAVRWNPHVTADYYRIKYSTTPGGTKTLLASSATSGQTVTGLTMGVQYYVVLSAVNAGSESADSAEVPFIIYPPGLAGAFDGDSRSEMTYVTPGGSWRILNSIGGYTTSTTVALGAAIPVVGDFDGDQRQDVAGYNATTGDWTILTSSSGFTSSISVNWGGPGYMPVAGDYDGDGLADPAVYRLSDGQWSVLKSSTNYTQSIVISWGGKGYTPVPGHDFDGDYRADIAVYQQSTGWWFILTSSSNYTATINRNWGGRGFTLVPGDYDHDGKCDLALYQRTTGNWYVLLSGAGYTTTLNKSWGGVGYLPVPGDYDGDGRVDLGVVEQATGNWYALLSSTGYTTTLSVSGWGTSSDRALSPAVFVGGDDASRASDWDGDGKAEITVYGAGTAVFSILTSGSNYAGAVNRYLGGAGFVGVPGDYDGDGKTDIAVYQGLTATWDVLLSSTNFTTSINKTDGGNNCVPVPADYDGDGRTDIAIYNTVTGQWFVLTSSSNYTASIIINYGGTGYTAVPADFDGDGKTDIAVYQQSTGNWSVLLSSTNYTTSLTRNVGGAGYVPVQADYDGDGKADFVVYDTTTGLWYGLKSSTNYTTTINVNWGGTGYVPVKGDFDGDGKTDLAVYQASSGTFYVLLSGANYTTALSKALGGPGFVAVPGYQ